MWAAGTGSSQTVCQMPETAVYQMPLGLSTCLPRGCRPVSVGSQTATTSSCESDCGFKASVISNVNGSYPPSCVPTDLPLTKTSARQSTAPKWSSNRPPFALDAVDVGKVRRYQSRCSGVSGRFTPESADSSAKG